MSPDGEEKKKKTRKKTAKKWQKKNHETVANKATVHIYTNTRVLKREIIAGSFPIAQPMSFKGNLWFAHNVRILSTLSVAKGSLRFNNKLRIKEASQVKTVTPPAHIIFAKKKRKQV